MSHSNLSPSNTFVLLMAVQLITLGAGLAGVHFLDVALSFTGAHGYIAIALGVLFALLSAAAALWLLRSNTAAGATLRGHCRDLHALFRHYSTAQIVALAAAAGICEELMFRGFLQPWLAAHSTPLLGLLGASIAFALLHYASFTYFAATLAVGLLLGIAYRATESLLCVMVWHGVYDLLAIYALARRPHLFDPPATGSR